MFICIAVTPLEDMTCVNSFWSHLIPSLASCLVVAETEIPPAISWGLLLASVAVIAFGLKIIVEEIGAILAQRKLPHKHTNESRTSGISEKPAETITPPEAPHDAPAERLIDPTKDQLRKANIFPRPIVITLRNGARVACTANIQQGNIVVRFEGESDPVSWDKRKKHAAHLLGISAIRPLDLRQ